MKACPFCAESILDAAIVCKHCGRNVVTRVPLPRWGRVALGLGVWLVMSVCGLAAVIAFIVYVHAR